jgi:hypothetical protein
MLVVALGLWAGVVHAQEFVYDGESLRDVIEDVERRSDWQFLYSDALVAPVDVGFRADAEALPDTLSRVLALEGIRVETDRERRRVLLVPAPESEEPQRRVVRGRVVDAETGEPLPFATVTWGSAGPSPMQRGRSSLRTPPRPDR